ncbi:MAG TPA: hypothetical protein VNI83_00975 [Vicinamibacterales bacterium]|nr:hypothetical protein [Vicinamibacterales bacterium]
MSAAAPQPWSILAASLRARAVDVVVVTRGGGIRIGVPEQERH